ncbi:hypothetical protein BJ875DRAFT_473910 [Amylocarpus encephaloides]|uniref:DUF1264-domain-containing protein n=1 Tax=Amylocarpus encephaloides TaxID=45428 RepID=A0A9P8C0W8_9HELO|nr:hypothetical protein BJ875DRAFT_473910 [Amylocarpus encephaloides]
MATAIIRAWILSMILQITTLTSLTAAVLPFGHLGPENTAIFLNGFHFLSGDTTAEISANHWCAILSDDFLQCVVYNTATTPSRLVGIEYIISPKAFECLDFEERQLWHSHQYEVTSGFLIEPGMPSSVDYAIMEVLVGTYGKTVHTWRYDQGNNSIPIGVPELVMGYTGESQITPDFVKERDELFGVNTTAIRESRKNLVAPPVIEGADSWKYGYVLTYGLVNTTTDTAFNQSMNATAT